MTKEIKPLRTLADFEKFGYGLNFELVVLADELRAEARKWVEELESGELNHLPEIGDFKIAEALVAVQILRRFFNLDNGTTKPDNP